MTILILPTGTCKDSHILALEADYLKRLKKPWLVEVRELKASKATSPNQAKQEEQATQLAAIRALPPHAVPILLHEHAPASNTEAFTQKLTHWLNDGKQPTFFIGGAAGFGEDVLGQTTNRLSLSPLTFPHQLCRVLLAEQIYRAFSLATNHPYHRP